jgi:hypothetical protein
VGAGTQCTSNTLSVNVTLLGQGKSFCPEQRTEFVNLDPGTDADLMSVGIHTGYASEPIE